MHPANQFQEQLHRRYVAAESILQIDVLHFHRYIATVQVFGTKNLDCKNYIIKTPWL